MRCITFCERQQGVCIYHENIKNSRPGFMRRADRACGGTAVYGRRNTLRSVFHVRRAYSDCSRRSDVRHGGGCVARSCIRCGCSLNRLDSVYGIQYSGNGCDSAFKGCALRTLLGACIQSPPKKPTLIWRLLPRQ